MSEPNVKVTLIPNGPARIECDKAEITLTDGTVIVKEVKFSLCRCGSTTNIPFCDGSHKTCGFEG